MSSKTDAVVKLSVAFLTCILFFSVGTFVGKTYSDNQHELAALEPQKNSHTEREVASVPTSPSAESEHKPGAMTDDEIAKLAEEFVADDTLPAKTEDSEHSAHVAESNTKSAKPESAPVKPDSAKPAVHKGDKGAPITKNEEPLSAAKNIVAGKTPTAVEHTAKQTTTQEERLPSSLPKDVAQFSVGKFTVQVAAYTEEAEAQKMASDLKNKGYSAFYVPANVKGKTYYRVSVGQFATQKEAQNYRAEFLNKAKVGSAIVQKITE